MDWKRAIEINKAALTRIVAALVALLAAQGGIKRLPLPVYQALARVLHPAESAVRRLILVAARKMVIPPLPVRAMPQGLVIAGKGTGRVAFQLFDSRKTFSDEEPEASDISGPYIRIIGDASPRSQFLALFARPTDEYTSEAETLRLTGRLGAVERALANLDHEAKRMARWRARRAAMKNPKFTTPIRPGAPPGLRKQSKDQIDSILRECHGLAWDVLTEDTS
jgi:hypothetical protein